MVAPSIHDTVAALQPDGRRDREALRHWHEQIVRELQRAPLDRHHPWRTPVLSTRGLDGEPQSRTVVLRRVDLEGCLLQFFTDRRTPKVQEIQADPRVALLLWNPRHQLQLRIQARAAVLVEGPVVEQAWMKMSQAPSRGDYLSARIPGQALEHTCAPDKEAGHHHLAVIECHALGWDALQLSRDGHRRAAWRFREGSGQDGSGQDGSGLHDGRWLVP